MKKIALPLLSLALLGLSSAAHAVFEVEPNNSSSTANVLSINEVMTGAFVKGQCSSGYDYFRFNLPEARPDVAFHFRNTTDNSKTVNLSLYDSANRSISIPVKTVNPYTMTSVDFKQNLAAGTYIVRLYTCYPTTDSDYELSVSTKVPVIPGIVGSVGMPDLNEDGVKDIALLRVVAEMGSVIETRNGSTGEVISTFPLAEEEQALKPVSIIGFDDTNVGILLYDSVTKTHTQTILNAQTGDPVASFPIE
ncbi:MAG: hypothetical protein QX199_15690 [Methylococcaceae bacterium]